MENMKHITRTDGNDPHESEYKPIKSTVRSGGIQINQRLPHIRFAAKLEKLLMDEWKNYYSVLFRNPVPRTVPGYYEMIKNPISLEDIREKIGAYQPLTTTLLG
jgi:hypothetical protein